jgi:hypothetical protein
MTKITRHITNEYTDFLLQHLDFIMKQITTLTTEVEKWRKMANAGHDQEVDQFGWCRCEDNDDNYRPYGDCPIRVGNQ